MSRQIKTTVDITEAMSIPRRSSLSGFKQLVVFGCCVTHVLDVLGGEDGVVLGGEDGVVLGGDDGVVL